MLEFDHVRGKTQDVAFLIGHGAPPERIRAEIARLDAEIAMCEVRCCNRHRRRTAAQRRRRARAASTS